ncbi:V-type proton ATPase subunit e 2-like [Oppia nitens]|uniref:V-type proton ATPase subunit e 2-like n=1 Tax=Oppia nitens TaxID=1686743 RepID=UPI0023DC0BB7|nr:V-type proton ATPase subunit e 2-like [Oppia nitens]
MGFGIFLLFTLMFGGIGAVGPMFLPEWPHRSAVKMMMSLGSVCCYAMWLTTYLSQLNPLFGPIISNETMTLMKKSWS